MLLVVERARLRSNRVGGRAGHVDSQFRRSGPPASLRSAARVSFMNAVNKSVGVQGSAHRRATDDQRAFASCGGARHLLHPAASISKCPFKTLSTRVVLFPERTSRTREAR